MLLIELFLPCSKSNLFRKSLEGEKGSNNVSFPLIQVDIKVPHNSLSPYYQGPTRKLSKGLDPVHPLDPSPSPSHPLEQPEKPNQTVASIEHVIESTKTKPTTTGNRISVQMTKSLQILNQVKHIKLNSIKLITQKNIVAFRAFVRRRLINV